MHKNITQPIYKTIIVSFKDKNILQAIPPDYYHKWEIFSISIKKKNIFYHWRTITTQPSFVQSSEKDFQASLDLVKNYNIENPSIIKKEDNVDNK